MPGSLTAQLDNLDSRLAANDLTSLTVTLTDVPATWSIDGLTLGLSNDPGQTVTATKGSNNTFTFSGTDLAKILQVNADQDQNKVILNFTGTPHVVADQFDNHHKYASQTIQVAAVAKMDNGAVVTVPAVVTLKNGTVYTSTVGQINTPTVITSLDDLVPGEVFHIDPSYNAGYVDNDYSRGPIDQDMVVVNDNKTNSFDTTSPDELGTNFIYQVSSNFNLSNVQFNFTVPDGVSATGLRFWYSKSNQQPQIKTLTVQFTDDTSKIITVPAGQTAAQIQQLLNAALGAQAIKSWSIQLAQLAAGVQLGFDFNDLMINAHYANDQKTPKAGDLLNGTMTASGTVELGQGTHTAVTAPPTSIAFLRLIDQAVPKKGNEMNAKSDQGDTRPGAVQAGGIEYSSTYSGLGHPYLTNPVMYIPVPANATLPDRSAIKVYQKDEGDNGHVALTPRAISILKINGRPVIKVDLSNYDCLVDGFAVYVPYGNQPDGQSSTAVAPAMVVSKALMAQDYTNPINHYHDGAEPDPSAAALMAALIQEEGIQLDQTDFYAEAEWKVLTVAGVKANTLVDGNESGTPSMTAGQDDHGAHADTFNVYGSISNATDKQLTNMETVINVPATSDGASQFDLVANGLPVVVDPLTGQTISTAEIKVANVPAALTGAPDLSAYQAVTAATKWSQVSPS